MTFLHSQLHALLTRLTYVLRPSGRFATRHPRFSLSPCILKPCQERVRTTFFHVVFSFPLFRQLRALVASSLKEPISPLTRARCQTWIAAPVQAHVESVCGRGSVEAEGLALCSSLHLDPLLFWVSEAWLCASKNDVSHIARRAAGNHSLDAILIALKTLCQFDNTAATAIHTCQSHMQCYLCRAMAG